MSLENERKKCPQCGKLNDAKNKFCSHCFSLIDENFDSDSITIEIKKPEKVSKGTADEEKGAKTEEEIKNIIEVHRNNQRLEGINYTNGNLNKDILTLFH
mgnify:CR=1 FL=1